MKLPTRILHFQTAMLSRFRPPNDGTGALQMVALSVICLVILLMAFIFVLRLIGKIAFSPSSLIED